MQGVSRHTGKQTLRIYLRSGRAIVNYFMQLYIHTRLSLVYRDWRLAPFKVNSVFALCINVLLPKLLGRYSTNIPLEERERERVQIII